MNTDGFIYFFSLFLLFWGWFVAYLTYQRKTIALKKTHRIQVDRTAKLWYDKGWRDGYDAAFELEPEKIRETCNKFFHTHYV